MSRRRFLGHLGQVGGVAAVYGAMTAMGLIALPPSYAGPPGLPSSMGKGIRVVILGGGIAGLVAAYELRKAGFAVTVLEASGRTGGRVFTVRDGSVIDEVDSRQVVSWDRAPHLFFDAGAARLPQGHQAVLGYARELRVPLEVLCNENRNALLHQRSAFGGQPVRNGRINADARGFVAELAAKAIDQASLGRPVSTEDREKLRAFLKSFGALDHDLRYRGSVRNGFRERPTAGTNAGRSYEPLDLQQLLTAEFWGGLYDVTEGPWQVAAMLRPVGGMSGITNALAGALGARVRYHRQALRLRRQAQGARIEWRDPRTGATGAIGADHVVVTVQPHVMLDVDTDFSPAVKEALAAPTSSPLAKVAFQAERRFWELDEQIYGGISWTDHAINQIWYPSQGIHAKKGILVGAYLFRGGEEFALKSPAERLEIALAGGEALHRDYRKYVGRGVSISWRKARFFNGASTSWSEVARKRQYPVLLEPDGPYHFAGEYLSHVNHWQEGAVRSAHFAIEQLTKVIQEKKA